MFLSSKFSQLVPLRLFWELRAHRARQAPKVSIRISMLPGIKADRTSYQLRTLETKEDRWQARSKMLSIRIYKTSTTMALIAADS
jgi:hypothetical protein